MNNMKLTTYMQIVFIHVLIGAVAGWNYGMFDWHMYVILYTVLYVDLLSFLFYEHMKRQMTLYKRILTTHRNKIIRIAYIQLAALQTYE